MLEWLGVVVAGVLLLFGVYAFTFSISMMLTKKNLSVRKFMGTEMWRSSIITSPLVIVFTLLLITLLGAGDLHSWGFQFLEASYILPTIIVGFIFGITVVFLERIRPRSQQVIKDRQSKNLLLFVLLIVVFASIAEEMLFRGFLQQWIDKTLMLSFVLFEIPFTSGAFIGAIVFGVIHALPAAQQGASKSVMVVSAFILGLTAGVMLSITSSLLAPIIVHAAFNLCGLANELISTGTTDEGQEGLQT